MSSPSSPKRLIGAAFAVACAALAAQAEEFSWQLSGATSRAEAGDFHRDSWAVDATYYVKPIDDSAGPYELASFLHPTTRVSAAASQSDADIVDDPTAYTVSGAYVLPGAKWYVGASYAKTDTAEVPPVTRADFNGYGLLAGRYLGANTTLELGFGRSERSSDTALACPPVVFNPPCVPGPLTFETNTDSVSLEVFHVRRFRSLTYSLQGSVSESDGEFEVSSPVTSLLPQVTGIDSRRLYSVATELFPTQRLGVLVGYSRPDGDFDIDSYNVAATWFFKPRVGVQFTLSRTNRDFPSAASHSENAGVRFIGRL